MPGTSLKFTAKYCLNAVVRDTYRYTLRGGITPYKSTGYMPL